MYHKVTCIDCSPWSLGRGDYGRDPDDLSKGVASNSSTRPLNSRLFQLNADRIVTAG